jgi:hypothetical protein
MFIERHTIALLAALSLSACASIDLPDVNFMEDSQFSAAVTEIDPSFPGSDEVPDIPNDVRTAAQWDESAREMQALSDELDAPELEPALSAAEFDREFDAAQKAAEAYKEDDPS